MIPESLGSDYAGNRAGANGFPVRRAISMTPSTAPYESCGDALGDSRQFAIDRNPAASRDSPAQTAMKRRPESTLFSISSNSLDMHAVAYLEPLSGLVGVVCDGAGSASCADIASRLTCHLIWRSFGAACDRILQPGLAHDTLVNIQQMLGDEAIGASSRSGSSVHAAGCHCFTRCDHSLADRCRRNVLRLAVSRDEGSIYHATGRRRNGFNAGTRLSLNGSSQ